MKQNKKKKKKKEKSEILQKHKNFTALTGCMQYPLVRRVKIGCRQVRGSESKIMGIGLLWVCRRGKKMGGTFIYTVRCFRSAFRETEKSKEQWKSRWKGNCGRSERDRHFHFRREIAHFFQKFIRPRPLVLLTGLWWKRRRSDYDN